MDALKVIAPQTPAGSPPFATSYQQSYGVPANPYFAAQGSTVYGSQVQSSTITYGDSGLSKEDLMALYQMNNRQIENLTKTLGVGLEGTQALTQQASQNALEIQNARARNLEIVTKAQALALTLDAARRAMDDKKVVTQTNTTTTAVVPNQPTPAPNAPQTPAPAITPNTAPQSAAPQETSLDKLAFLFQRDCSSCHDSATKKAGLDLQSWQSFDAATKMKCYTRVTLPISNAKHMPQTKDGSPGRQWSPDEAKLLLVN